MIKQTRVRDSDSSDGEECTAQEVSRAIWHLAFAGLAELHATSGGETWLRLNSGELFCLHQQGLTRIS